MTVKHLREALSFYDDNALVVFRDPEWGFITITDTVKHEKSDVFDPDEPHLYRNVPVAIEVYG